MNIIRSYIGSMHVHDALHIVQMAKHAVKTMEDIIYIMYIFLIKAASIKCMKVYSTQ